MHMKLRAIIAAALTAACFLLTGCTQTDRNADRIRDAAVFREIEKKALACLAENDEKPEDIWNLNYDEEKNMFTNAAEMVCISRYGHIIHGSCENPPPVIGEERISSNMSIGASKSIEYDLERMAIDLDAEAYHGMKNRNRSNAMTVPYCRLREPERYRMNRVAACLNAANRSLIHRLDK